MVGDTTGLHLGTVFKEKQNHPRFDLLDFTRNTALATWNLVELLSEGDKLPLLKAQGNWHVI